LREFTVHCSQIYTCPAGTARNLRLISDELSLYIHLHLCVCFFQGKTQTILWHLQELKPQFGKFLYDPNTAAAIPSVSSLGAVSEDAVQ
jgi:hypothetical protein